MDIFELSLANKTLLHFPHLKTVSAESPMIDISHLLILIQTLKQEFNTRFLDFQYARNFCTLFSNPLNCNIIEQKEEFQLELCDLQNELYLNKNEEISINFWKKICIKKYPNIKNMILKLYSMFSSTYFCESSFSKLKIIKSPKRNSLSDSHL